MASLASEVTPITATDDEELLVKQLDAIFNAINEVALSHNCTGVQVWDWDLNHIPYVGGRPPTSVRDFSSRSLWILAANFCLSAFAVPGNVIAIALILRSRPINNALNYYLINLAVADIVISSFCSWVHTIAEASGTTWILGPVVCKLSGFIESTALTASTLTLTAIAVDRYLAVKYPLKIWRMEKLYAKIIAVIWSFAVLVSLPFLIFRTHATIEWMDYDEHLCVDAWPQVKLIDEENGGCIFDDQRRKIYYTTVSVAMFFMPLCLMALFYILIGMEMWNSRVPGRSEVVGDRAVQVADAGRIATRNKVVKMAGTVMAAFCICWTPLQGIYFYSTWVHDPRKHGKVAEGLFTALFVASWMAYANSAINPILYGSLNPTFRNALTRRLSSTFRACCVFLARRARPRGFLSPRLNVVVTSAADADNPDRQQDPGCPRDGSAMGSSDGRSEDIHGEEDSTFELSYIVSIKGRRSNNNKATAV